MRYSTEGVRYGVGVLSRTLASLYNAHMITSNVIHRTFRIKYGESYGTCFTIDVDGRQYIVTAAHVVEGISGSSTVEIFFENRWQAHNVVVVGSGPADVDVAVLAPSWRLSPEHPLPPASDGITLGQDVYFLGFPYNMFTDIGEKNRNFPLPFVKRAAVSSWSRDEHGVLRWFLDGHNNPGFSGGPAVWTQPMQNDYSVAAVISGYRYADEPIYDGDAPTTLAYRYNTGIIIAYDIEHALALIHRNPVGLQVM